MFFQAKADTISMSAEEISTNSGVNAQTITRNVKFLTSVGILVADQNKKDKYFLTQKGAEYATFLGKDDKQKAGEVLKEILPSSPLSSLVGYIQLQGASLTYDNLFNHIKTLARVKVDANGAVIDPVKAGIRCLIFLLVRAGFVPDNIISQTETPKPPSAPSRKAVKQTKDVDRDEAKINVQQNPLNARISQTSTALPFNVNISIEAKDAESIKQVIELIKQLRSSHEELS